MKSNDLSFCIDTLLVEATLSDPKLYKKADIVSGLLNGAKTYFDSKIDHSNPAASVLNLIAPGALWLLFRSLGIGRFGFFLGLLMDVFHIDVNGLLTSIYDKVKELVQDGKPVSSSQIDSAVNESASEFSRPASPDEAAEAYQKLKQQKPEEAFVDDKFSSLELIPDAKLINLALIDYEHHQMRLFKAPIKYSLADGSWDNFFGTYSRRKAKGTNILAKIIGWVIKIALASAGLMVAGDIVNHFLGRPNSLDHTYQAGQPETSVPVTSAPLSTQTKFKLKGDAPLPSSFPLTNTPDNIQQMLIQFAKDVYDNLDGKETIIANSSAFQAVKEQINWYNSHNTGSSVIFIPKAFASKKQLVDHFIDDVAKNSP